MSLEHSRPTEFATGDEVFLSKTPSDRPESLTLGARGTVMVIYEGNNTGVSWHDWAYGHDLHGLVHDGSGWFVDASCLQLANPGWVWQL